MEVSNSLRAILFGEESKESISSVIEKSLSELKFSSPVLSDSGAGIIFSNNKVDVIEVVRVLELFFPKSLLQFIQINSDHLLITSEGIPFIKTYIESTFPEIEPTETIMCYKMRDFISSYFEDFGDIIGKLDVESQSLSIIAGKSNKTVEEVFESFSKFLSSISDEDPVQFFYEIEERKETTIELTRLPEIYRLLQRG
jgi:hypothetical protein